MTTKYLFQEREVRCIHRHFIKWELAKGTVPLYDRFSSLVTSARSISLRLQDYILRMKRHHCVVLLSILVFLAAGCHKEASKNQRAVNASGDNRAHITKHSAPLGGTLQAIVIGITDGDTVVVLDSNDQFHEIRLKGIDAPELRQAFGDISRAYLARKLAGKEVTIESQKRDRYGRLVGKVILEGRDVCLEQIKAGLAWHYKKFEN
jgi:endonuclease YncB( thermonuclease family)